MGTIYATVSDILARGKTLTAAQMEAAETLLSDASSLLRVEARSYGKDIDALIAADEDFGVAVKSKVVQAVIRALDSQSSDSGSVISQGSETLGAYSYSVTYANAGQSLYFLKSELRDLGLRRGQFGALPPLYQNQEAQPP